MYDFIFPHWSNDGLLTSAGAERRTRARGPHFTAAELDELLTLWRPLRPIWVAHDAHSLRLTTPAGEGVTIAREGLGMRSPGTINHSYMRLAALHAARYWGGERRVSGADEFRLWGRAYGDVYGVVTYDPGYLSPDLEARLPAMRAQVRAMHPDAPPDRPNEAATIAAAYARRFPFAIPRAA